jgi:hypothetical protein
MKTAYLHTLYLNYPVLLPVFSYLVAWARTAGIVKSDPKDSATIPTAEFYAFILKMLSGSWASIEKQDFVLYPIERLQVLFDFIYDNVKTCNEKAFFKVGEMVLKFFRNASNLQGRMTYEWPEKISGSNRIISFEAATVKVIAGECEKALQNLYVYRSARMLLCHVSFFF